MTLRELTPLVEQYRAGLDAELMLLHRLQAIAVDQRRASETGSVTEMQGTVDNRDRVMATLVTVEHELKGVRQQLLKFREYLADMPAFQEIVALHRQAAARRDLLALAHQGMGASPERGSCRRSGTRSCPPAVGLRVDERDERVPRSG